MTPRQNRIIRALVIANAAVILTLVVFVAHLPPAPPATPLPSPGPSGPLSARACQWHAVQLLSQASLGGKATLTSDQTLRWDVVYPVLEDQNAEEAAQHVWTVFDIAQTLSQDRCDRFYHVAVVIQAQGTQSTIQIRASVDTTDLDAYYNGELSESEFINRVQYEARLLE
jgi:hypothetical protein